MRQYFSALDICQLMSGADLKSEINGIPLFDCMFKKLKLIYLCSNTKITNFQWIAKKQIAYRYIFFTN